MNMAISKDSNIAMFYERRSDLHVELGKYKNSVEDTTRGLELRQNCPILLYKRGLAYYSQREFNKAIEDLESALKALKEDNSADYKADLYYHIGLSFAHLNQYKESIPPFTEAIGLAPLKIVYKHERAKCYLLTGDFKKSVEDFDAVIVVQPNNAHAYFGRAFAYKSLKDFGKSAEDFEKAHSLEPGNPNLRINYKKINDVRFIKICEAGQEME